jgi:hypothetical protein
MPRHLYWDFGIRGIANPECKVFGTSPSTKTRNSVPPVHSPTSPWPTLSFGCRGIMFRDIVIPVAMFMGLPPLKPRYGVPRVNLMTLMVQIYGPVSPKIRTSRRFQSSSSASLRDLTVCRNSGILLREF